MIKYIPLILLLCSSCSFDDIISIKSGDDQEEVSDRSEKNDSWSLGLSKYSPRPWWDVKPKKK